MRELREKKKQVFKRKQPVTNYMIKKQKKM